MLLSVQKASAATDMLCSAPFLTCNAVNRNRSFTLVQSEANRKNMLAERRDHKGATESMSSMGPHHCRSNRQVKHASEFMFRKMEMKIREVSHEPLSGQTYLPKFVLLNLNNKVGT